MKKLSKLFALVVAGALVTGALSGCGAKEAVDSSAKDDVAASEVKGGGTADNETTAQSGDAAQEPVTVKLGVVGENNETWAVISEILAEENINLELVKFADYSLPNQALADGEIDLNSFQHYAYLNNEIAEKGLDLTVIGDTIIAPLGLYSDKITDISQLKDGDLIAIPSDATNGGRSLKVLETAGLITVDPAAGYVPTLSDIVENPLNLEFIEVEAANTASLLPDVAAAIINGGHAVDNGFSPAQDAIYLEPVVEGAENPYINVIVARTEDKDNEVYKRIVEVYQTEEIAAVIEDTYKGSYIPAWK